MSNERVFYSREILYSPGHLHGTITQCCFIMHAVDTVLNDAYCVMLSTPDRPKFEAQRA